MYEDLDQFFPEPVASGLYYAYKESDPFTQLAILGELEGYTKKEIGQALGIHRTLVNRRLAKFRQRVRDRVPCLPSGWCL